MRSGTGKKDKNQHKRGHYQHAEFRRRTTRAETHRKKTAHMPAQTP